MKKVPIGEVTEPPRTWNPRASPGLVFDYVDLSTVDASAKKLREPTRVAASEAPSRARQLISTGDVLVSTVRPNLNAVAVVRESFEGATASTGFTVLRPKANLHGPYLFHWVRSADFINEMVRKATGASYPAVSDRIIKNSTLPLPSLDEQRKIAAILDQADAIRTKRREALAHLDTLNASAMRALLDRPYPRASLGDLLIGRPKNGLYLPRSHYGDGVPIVRIDSFPFGTGRLNTAGLRRLRADASLVAEFGLAVGDILVNRVNSAEHVGKAALIRCLEEPTVFESNMMRLRLDPSRVLPEYAIEALLTTDVRSQIAPMVKRAVNQASINQSDVRAITIPLPPVEAQRHFATIAKQTTALRSHFDLALASDDELFASLQSRAFRGEL